MAFSPISSRLKVGNLTAEMNGDQETNGVKMPHLAAGR